MKNTLGVITLNLLLAGCFSACGKQPQAAEENGARVALLSNHWNTSTSNRTIAELDGRNWSGPLPALEDITKGFSIRFNADFSIPNRDRCLLQIPGVLDVCLRQHNPLDRDKQNYPAFKMADGSVPVLEAVISLKTPMEGKVEKMPVGIPLAMLESPLGRHDVLLNFTGARWTMYVDGQLLDNDFPLGYPLAEQMDKWEINPDFVSKAELVYPAVAPVRKEGTVRGDGSQVQFWTPAGHNTWVGDVVSLYHKDTYHLFYLYDRRGHQSKLGRGGHYFEHLSTKDFKHWTEHEAAVPVEEQWETFGTGTPFVYDDKLCISYGYHTTRIYPREQTTLPELYEYLDKKGHTGAFDRHQMRGVAAGASYSVSEDGVHFAKTGVLFHPCENPSIYVDPEGRLKMLANYGAQGTWASDSVNGGWHCLNENFPLGGDCTFFFHWGDYDYIIGGFTRLWSKRAEQPDSAYKDMVASGVDFYNGLCVPTISRIFDNRYVMAGWMWMKAWGGPLVIHELVQLPDGRIGTKWMDELVLVTLNRKVAVEASSNQAQNIPCRSFLLTFDVNPTAADGRLSVCLLPSADKALQDACEWRLDNKRRRAQYSFVTARADCDEKTLREGGAPQSGRNYAIEQLPDTDGPFTVRMLVKASDKFDGTMVDTEIAGKRTMISYREKLFVDRLQFACDKMEITNLKVVPLAE